MSARKTCLRFLPPWKENEVGTFPDTPVTLLARIAVEATGQRTDEAAWVRLFNLYAPAIRRFAELQGTPSAESEDVTQDIFLRLVAILRGGRYRADAGRFRCYLATLVRNELVSRWRKVQARAACVPLDAVPDEAIATLPPEAAALLDAKWRLARHEAAVEHALIKTALSRPSTRSLPPSAYRATWSRRSRRASTAWSPLSRRSMPSRIFRRRCHRRGRDAFNIMAAGCPKGRGVGSTLTRQRGYGKICRVDALLPKDW